MTTITIHNFDDDLKTLLQKRAEFYGRSLEEKAKEILRAVLTDSTDKSLNIAAAIERRLAKFGYLEVPTVPREPLRERHIFEYLHDCTRS